MSSPISQKNLLILALAAFLLAASAVVWTAAAQDDDLAPKSQAAPVPSDSAIPPGQPKDTDNVAPAAKSESSAVAESFCVELGWAAVRSDLPADFFLRLIYQESRFDPHAVSPAGALGIAQFMPATAHWRGLADPFAIREALRESARWLAELRDQFGNLGLAAAAYNAGPKRVEDWLVGKGGLPNETRHYVQVITGHSAEEWARSDARDQTAYAANKAIPCDQVAAVLVKRASYQQPHLVSGELGPWGLQLAGGWSKARALADYAGLQRKFPAILGDRPALVLANPVAGRGSAMWYRVRVAEATREKADELCRRLEKAGGECLVFRN